MALGREVEDRVTPSPTMRAPNRIGDVAVNEAITRISVHVREIFRIACVGQAVEIHDAETGSSSSKKRMKLLPMKPLPPVTMTVAMHILSLIGDLDNFYHGETTEVQERLDVRTDSSFGRGSQGRQSHLTLVDHWFFLDINLCPHYTYFLSLVDLSFWEIEAVTKKEIVKQISEALGLTQLKTKEIVQKTFDAIVDTLLVEKRIELRNFGVFEVKQRKARKAQPPHRRTRRRRAEKRRNL